MCYGRDEWQYLVDRFSLNDRGFGKLIPSVCSQFNTQERLEEVNNICSIPKFNSYDIILFKKSLENFYFF